jgi:hypothetical protein
MCYTPFDRQVPRPASGGMAGELHKGESSSFLGTVNILFNESYAKWRDFLDGVNRSHLLACEDGKKHSSQTIDRCH